MRKHRILAATVLTAGLGLSGVATASASGTADSPSGQATSAASRSHGAPVHCMTTGSPAKGGPSKTSVRVVDGKFHAGDPTAQGMWDAREKSRTKCGKLLPLPGHGGGKGKVITCVILDGKAVAKPGGKPGKSTVRVEKGKVYVNGKLAPKGKLKGVCPAEPPVLGKAGKPAKGVTAGSAAALADAERGLATGTTRGE
ncbi:hypothetical protein [Streptomyces sp. NPDC127108]|uniref:hypothetical protein n=1 Tax=Streptomyces sp. NPDC127108 TaxID=3345361 RepID=UPI00363547A4